MQGYTTLRKSLGCTVFCVCLFVCTQVESKYTDPYRADTDNEGEEEEGVPESLYIKWDRTMNRIEVFGSDRKVAAAKRDIKSYLASLKAGVTLAVPLDAMAFRAVIKEYSSWTEAVTERTGVTSIMIDLKARQLVVTGSSSSVQSVAAEVRALIAKPGLVQITRPARADDHDGATCPICRCDIDTPYPLSACGHPYCTVCVTMLLTNASSNNAYPVLCCAPGCTAPVVLKDFVKLLTTQELENSRRAAFRAYVSAHVTEWGQCLSPDCPQIYSKGEPELYCDCCLEHWCTVCKIPYHTGKSCAAHQSAQSGDKEFDQWRQRNTKSCPREGCGAPIEKNGGCNHMVCKCGCHFCWKCKARFLSDAETYTHLRTSHGGVYDVQEEWDL